MTLSLAAPVYAADYDLVISNGRVMDPETNYDALANVGIKNGKIAVITKDKIKGTQTINMAKSALLASPQESSDSTLTRRWLLRRRVLEE